MRTITEETIEGSDPVFRITASEIQEIHVHMQASGGNRRERDAALEVLKNVVERSR